MIASTLPGQSPASHRTASADGFLPDRLARVDTFLQTYVDSNRIAGAVALVLKDGRVVYERAVGWADKEGQRRMTPDAMFRIASQSKALTSIAIMMLVEEGKIALNNPVSRFIPAYARTTVATRGDTGRVITPANHAITIKELLTHTAGISYGRDTLVAPLYTALGLGASAGFGWYTADKDEPICTTMERLATLPFVRQPGEAFVYGYNTDILGCVVERVSGMSLDEFIRKRITGPLGMSDTYFFVPESKAERLVAVYDMDASNHAVRAPEGPRGQGHYLKGPRRSYSGGAGLVSTARDFSRLLQMLLNRGQLDGVRLLSPKTVDVMTTNQVGSLYGQGVGFGLGFSVVQWPGADNTLLSEGTFGWGGAYGSEYRVDPKERIVLVFMMNEIPGRPDIGQKFPTMIYQALAR
ncbi:MAG TPA: serine hydrolase domain-containing protein [Gemmatimonadaceae bacterium]|nr:serine hydrolase domain-containing protein [Gemmatimonadaceae bacterium]